jgi:hypothetical protein
MAATGDTEVEEQQRRATSTTTARGDTTRPNFQIMNRATGL